MNYPDLFLCIQNAITHGSSISPHSPIIDARSAGLDRPHGQMMSHDMPHQAMHSMGDPAFAGCYTPTPPSTSNANDHQGSPTSSVEIISFRESGNDDEQCMGSEMQ